MLDKLSFERVKISSLTHDPRNARKHDARNIKTIMDSLQKFGQQKNIVVSEDNVILAGNGTIEAAKKLGWDEIDIKRSHLKGEEAIAYSLLDNRSAELAEWDEEVLGDILGELDASGWDLGDLGWSDEDMQNLKFKPNLRDENDEDKDPKYTLTLTLKNEDEQQELFAELRDRGFKVKV
jgi:ParB-like chromosome segregation protein Spo0J